MTLVAMKDENKASHYYLICRMYNDVFL